MKSRLLVACALLLLACDPPGNPGGDSTGDDDGPDMVCVPGMYYCDGFDDQDVWRCNDDGTGGSFDHSCPEEQACGNGSCVDDCTAAESNPSTVGCHFYAVDLDNEAAIVFGGGFVNDAAAQQFAVAVANVNDYPVQVQVLKNVAPFGQAIQEETVTSVTVPANDLVQIDLPQREVDGCMGQNGTYAIDSGSGTFVSSHAYRIESNGPIVAYQFQPIVQQYSNDASILIPRQALGKHNMVLGWPTSNPCGAPMGDPLYMQSIPDHTSVTIIGVEENTHVTVVPTHPIKASGGPSGLEIPMTPAGTALEFDLGPYDVVNLESEQFIGPLFDCIGVAAEQNGDFTGTMVTSNKPVAVFSSNERGNGTAEAEPPEPPGWDGETCCTDHLEEQMFPVEALGWKFAISRSPVRSTMGGYEEPDLYRVLATVDGTMVKTSLGAPFDQFTLNGGEWKTFYAYGGFTVESTGGAIMVGQYLVSQHLVPGGIGDPTFTIFPAADQHRDHYVFLVPDTFETNYMVLAMPMDATVVVDGADEFPPACSTRGIGTLDGVTYKQVTCELEPGTHRVTTSAPAGLTVYGYYTVGSYGYPGGSDVDIINPID